MPYTIELGDMRITCATLEELAGVVATLRGLPPQSTDGAGRSGGSGEMNAANSGAFVVPAPAAGESTPLRFLRAVHSAGRGGVLNSVIARGLGIGSPKGLGPVLVALRHELARASMHQNDAMSVTKTPEGTRYTMSERTAEAIQKLSRAGTP